MRDLIQRASSGELRELMNMTLESESITDAQADLLNNIINELKGRGEIINLPEDEVTAQYEATLRLHKAKSSAAADKPVYSNEPKRKIARSADIKSNLAVGGTIAEPTAEEEHPLLKHIPQILEDARRDRAEQRQRRMVLLRLPIAAVSMIVILLLSNAVALAAGYDFFGAVAKWSKDAVYFAFGTDSAEEPVQGTTKEYDSLKLVLESIGIQVDLPASIPGGFMYDSIEPDEPNESSNIVAWYVYLDDYFSISIKRIAGASSERFSESDGEEYSEIYTKGNGQFMVTTNKDRVVAIWYQGVYEVMIQGSITYEQLTQILDSI